MASKRRFLFPRKQGTGGWKGFGYTQDHKSRSVESKSCDQQGFGAVEYGRTLRLRKKTPKLLCRAAGKEVKASDSKVTRGPKNIYLTSI